MSVKGVKTGVRVLWTVLTISVCTAVTVPACAQGLFDSPGTRQPNMPTDVVGRVMLAPDVPAAGCVVSLLGVQRTNTSDTEGRFKIPDVPSGFWTLVVRVIDPPGVPIYEREKVYVPSLFGGFVVDLGEIIVAKPGAILGRLVADVERQGQGTEAWNRVLDNTVVFLPQQRIWALPEMNGGFCLPEWLPAGGQYR